MIRLLKTNRRLALVGAGLVVSGTLGYSAARARGAGKPPGLADRKQTAAIAAERDRALTALADARMRHRIAQRVIQRYAEELAYVDQLNAALRRELESRPAGGRGGLSAAGPLQ